MIVMKTSMNASDLKEKWELLTREKLVHGYRSLRITKECVPEINLGITKTSFRCLILSLPKSQNIDLKPVIKEKIAIEHNQDFNFLLITLQDGEYSDLFDDLVVSLYNAIKDLSSPSDYSKVFVNTFHKWSKFFEEEETERLSKNIVKGLFGELHILKELLGTANSYNVDDILESWRGPYDQGHDFILDGYDLEVKTKDEKKLDVRISSEFQLDSESGKELMLVVLSVEYDPVRGLTIKNLVNDIRQTVINYLGDTTILLRAIRQKGLSLINIGLYDNYRFRPVDKSEYNCLHEGFPKLIKNNIPDPISNVKYDLNLSHLEQFLVSRSPY